MMSGTPLSQSPANSLENRTAAYHDLNGLQSIAQVGRDNTAEGLRQVAGQFEAMFLNIMIKEMRSAGQSLFEDNYLRSNEMDIHQENFDNQLAMEMSGSGGIGLADTLYRQLAQRYGVEQQNGRPDANTSLAPRAAAAYREVSRHESD